jgi:hypothetical protein
MFNKVTILKIVDCLKSVVLLLPRGICKKKQKTKYSVERKNVIICCHAPCKKHLISVDDFPL